MGAGALDAVNTPVFETPATQAADPLVAKIETIRKLIGSPAQFKGAALHESVQGSSGARPEALVAIGASAGGPGALARMLSQLPAEFSAPVVIVQHVDAQFAEGLADWLRRLTRLNVRIARDGERPTSGTVLLAGTENHLSFNSSGRLAYTSHPQDCSYKPSVDVFFKSAERFWPGQVIGVLLTGMGRDGAEGLRALRVRGHHTIAQDRASSAVFGMPKAAADLNAASEILPLERIGPRLVQLLGRKANVHA
jgi:chemotaxis response regulator CheB